MSRIAYVNGRYLAHREARVHIEDRGFQFADSVYEVCEIRDGALIDATRHLDRLERSMGELRMPAPMGRAALLVVLREVARRNLVRNGHVYLQVSRGVAPRDFPFPAGAAPTLVVTARSKNVAEAEARALKGVAVAVRPDIRWGRRDIKTTGLLANALAKQHAREHGAFEAWLVDERGFVTEGASSNAWIVTADGALVTRAADHMILRGVTRTTLFDVAAELQLRIEERPFTVEEARRAREAFMTSANSIVIPIVAIDGAKVGDGAPGPTALRLRALFHASAEATQV
ncbi:MAG: D-amino-acid transaminase [Methylobacteriaceae bacterium]|nr:D-amino-acid transaminase [Methylobacteriaceae bacterium]